MPHDEHVGSVITGRHTELVPLTRSDYDFVYRLEALGPMATRYRFRGITPNPERFSEMIWTGVLTQHVIVWKKDRRRIGTALCYSADFRNRHARIGGAMVHDAPTPYALEGFVLLLDYLFDEFDFRKLYGDSFEGNASTTQSAIGPLMHEEGRLRQHEFVDGTYQDVLTLAIYRDEWLALRSSMNDAGVPVNERLAALRRATTLGSIGSSLAERLRAAARIETTSQETVSNG